MKEILTDELTGKEIVGMGPAVPMGNITHHEGLRAILEDSRRIDVFKQSRIGPNREVTSDGINIRMYRPCWEDPDKLVELSISLDDKAARALMGLLMEQLD